MSDRHWLRDAAIVGAGCLVAFVVGWLMLGSYQARHAEERHAYSNPNEQPTSPPQLFACMGLETWIERYVCTTQAIAAQPAERDPEYDLHAQQDMAEWAFGLLLVGVLTLGVTGLGVIYVARTLAEQRKATEAAVRVAQSDRAWMLNSSYIYGDAENFRISGKEVAVGYHAQIILKNYGKTPARLVELLSDAKLVPKGEPVPIFDFPIPASTESMAVVAPDGTISADRKAIDGEGRAALFNRTSTWFVYGRICYFVSGDETLKVTEICTEIMLDGSSATGVMMAIQIKGPQNRAS